MPESCVVFGCSNERDEESGISLHPIPYLDDSRTEAKKRRDRWIKWVQLHRADWTATPYSLICSEHFRNEDFARRFMKLPGMQSKGQQRLNRDSFGINVYPTIFRAKVKSTQSPLSSRAKRQIMRDALQRTHEEPKRKRIRQCLNFPDSVEPSTSGEVTPPKTNSLEEPSSNKKTFEVVEPVVEKKLAIEQRKATPQDVDIELKSLGNKNRMLRNDLITLREKLKTYQKAKRKAKRRESQNQRELQPLHTNEQSADSCTSPASENEIADATQNLDQGNELDSEFEFESNSENEEEPDYQPEEEDERDDDEDEEIYIKNTERLFVRGNLRTEPKHIVFLSQLLLLFKFCLSCKADGPLVEARQVGTEVVVKTLCRNPKCSKKENIWHSQPKIPGWDLSAGNLLLCMAILVAGGSATKCFQIFSHMGLGCISLNTFFKHQRNILFPTISLYWKKYQGHLLAVAKAKKEGVVIAGDGRHDSMGHSAKFGAYTIFCCTTAMIICFSLVQRNQAGSSTAMEFYGFERCMEFLLGYGLIITTFISDRHGKIKTTMKTVYKHITHYFDIWHLKKKVRKVLSKIAKLKGCEAVENWIKPCENHLYWSATSTFSGNGTLIWDKFRSFLNHIVNKHTGFKDTIFDKCAHKDDLQPREWLKSDSVAYEKVCSALNNQSLISGIKQASPLDQTSCLEGFHSVLNHFAPKMIAFSYIGMYCRHILAAVHFNHNLHRETRKRKSDGKDRVLVSYPKFKNGEATVRNQPIAQNFAYVEDIYQTFLITSKSELEMEAVKLKHMTPQPMHSMLNKQSRHDAVNKKVERSKKVVKDVPATCSTATNEQVTTTVQGKRQRRCKQCKHLMGPGHKEITTCPKNIKKKQQQRKKKGK